ncbi:MAG: phosphate ABC transporter permease subunit PstC [Methylacidiphilales bacterium]|nr:phosphate ABC transporter permease subunit PstC [Candidatus Methylacidiphilales bacterium]
MVERIARFYFICSAILVSLITVCIVGSILFESISFFGTISIWEFFLSTQWEPSSNSNEHYGAIPLFFGTIAISLISMSIAVPFGVLTAIYLSEYIKPNMRKWLKPIIEFIAGIPTVVYGFFAAMVVGPQLRSFAEFYDIPATTESSLACGIVMGVMIIPYISSMSDDIIQSIPENQRQSSLALGANKSETILRIVIPAALPGIIAACILGLSRAIGETMIVVMASGLTARISLNPFESLTTVTVQIVGLLTGDLSFEGVSVKAAYALGLTLFISTFIFNALAIRIITYYRKKYV